jgi:hypothetical protein
VSPPCVRSYLAHCDFPAPRPERPFPPPLAPRKFADHDEENLPGQVVPLVAEPGDAPKPAADQRWIDLLQAPPVGGIRPGHLESTQQAKGPSPYERQTPEDNASARSLLGPLWGSGSRAMAWSNRGISI